MLMIASYGKCGKRGGGGGGARMKYSESLQFGVETRKYFKCEGLLTVDTLGCADGNDR